MWTILKIFIEFVTVLLLFYVLVLWPQGMWDLNSLTRDRTCTSCIGRQSLNHWTTREVPLGYISNVPSTLPIFPSAMSNQLFNSFTEFSI